MKPNLKRIQGRTGYPVPDQQSIEKLAKALNRALRIQTGREFIYWLGTGEEETNQQAIQTWVRAQLLDHGLLPTRQTLAFLMVELEKSLNRWEADR